MSERTFRGVVAAVLVLALVLAVVVTVATLNRPTPPPPSPTPAITSAPTSVPSPTTTPSAGPVFNTPTVVSVGLIERGKSSEANLVLAFVEVRADAIPNAPGAFIVRLADHAGDASTIAFVGTPHVSAPGSLGATAVFAAPNALRIDIVASDPLNVEAMTITGLGIGASATAATGPVRAEASDLTGSLEGGLGNLVLNSPGSVIEPQ